MDNLRLEKQIQFLVEIDKLKTIFRNTYLADGSRKENDAEHSWHLGLAVLILSEYFEKIDHLKTIKMVLIHDLVEIIAGDTYCYDQNGQAGKFEREQAAARKLLGMLPEDQGDELYRLWLEFECVETPEARCAAMVDRLQPLLLNLASGGKSWLEHGINAEQVRERNTLIFRHADPRIADLVTEIIEEAVAKGYLKKGNGALERD